MIWPDYDVWIWVGLGALALAAVVALGVAWLKRWSALPGMRYPARERLTRVNPGVRARLVHLPLALRTLGVLALLAALTRPQLTSEETAEVEGIDIVVALDMSGSMASVDITDEALIELQNQGKEPKDRFSAAIEVIRDFIESRKYDRISLVTFGAEAFLQFPLTLDYGTMLRILGDMKLGDIDGSGTVIGNALTMSLARIKDSKSKTRIIILITDGEDNGSNVAPLEMAGKAAELGLRVFTILVGTEDQSRQPTEMVDAFSGHRVYRKVEYPVNPDLLQKIADETGGRFYRSVDNEALAKDFHAIIDEFDKSRLVDYAAAERTELFLWFLIPGLALLLLELLLSQTVLRRFP